MVIKATVLVVGDEDDRILPVGSAPDRIDDTRDECLAALDVFGRMLVVPRVEEGHLRQGRGAGKSCGDGEKVLDRPEVGVCGIARSAKGTHLWADLVVVRPADTAAVEKIEDRARTGLEAIWREVHIPGRHVAERGGSHE